MFEILYASDSRYFELMMTSIYSLLENNKNILINLHIVDGGFSDEQKLELEKMLYRYGITYKIHSIDVIRKYLDKFNIPLWRGTEVSNARLFASEIIKDDYKAIYIDSDTIIDGPIEHLFYTDNEYPISASREIIIPKHMKNKTNEYYNSGVLLYDFRVCDDNKFLDKLLKTSKEKKDLLVYPDQDLLNIALYDEIGRVPFSYNISPKVYDVYNYPHVYSKSDDISEKTIDEIVKELEKPCIYHMLSYMSVRPWQENNIHPFNEILEEYLYKVYPNYKKEEIDLLVAKLSLLPSINRLGKMYVPKFIDKGIKKVMKRALCKEEL